MARKILKKGEAPKARKRSLAKAIKTAIAPRGLKGKYKPKGRTAKELGTGARRVSRIAKEIRASVRGRRKK